MGTKKWVEPDAFAETANVDYDNRLPIKKNKLPFPFPFAANKRKIVVSVFSVCT